MRHLAPLMMVLSIACSSSPVVIVEDVGFTITVEPETVQIVEESFSHELASPILPA